MLWSSTINTMLKRKCQCSNSSSNLLWFFELQSCKKKFINSVIRLMALSFFVYCATKSNLLCNIPLCYLYVSMPIDCHGFYLIAYVSYIVSFHICKSNILTNIVFCIKLQELFYFQMLKFVGFFCLIVSISFNLHVMYFAFNLNLYS